MNEDKILYQIISHDSDYIKDLPDKVRTINGTNYYYYDFKNHRYLTNFISDDFNVYDEIAQITKENQQLKEQVAYMRRSIERKEEQIIDLQHERVPMVYEEKKELIDYLKEKKKEYIELHNKSCDIIDFDRYESLNILCEEILSKIEKE